MNLNSKIYIAGHRGMVGSAIWRSLESKGYTNLMVQTNVIHAGYTHGVKKLLFLGSSCIYPKLAPPSPWLKRLC